VSAAQVMTLGSHYQIRMVKGQKLRAGDPVTVDTGGCVKKARSGDRVYGVVTESTSGNTAKVALYDFDVEISPDGTLKVWEEVDLETGYGGRV